MPALYIYIYIYIYIYFILFYFYIRFLFVGPGARDICNPSDKYSFFLYRLRSHCSIVAFLPDLYGPD